jgi:TolA-binding protein
MSKVLTVLPIRLAVLLVGLLPMCSAGAQDNSTFECGRNLFKSAKYKDALPYLKSAESLYAYDNRAFYYEALCYHRMGQLNAAMTAYQNVIAKFPDSDAAELSKKAIASLRGGSSSSSVAGGSLRKLKNIAVDQLPSQLVLKVAEQGGKPVVEALVSGVKVKFVVDTAVANSVIGTEVAKQAKLPEAAVKSKDEYYLHDIKLDAMTRAAFPIQISSKQPNLAVLGADFFEYSTVGYAPAKASPAVKDEPTANAKIDNNVEVKESSKEPAKNELKEGTLTIKKLVGVANPFEVGLKQFNAGRLREAYPLLKTSAVNRPRDPRALYLLAVCSQRLHKLDEARASYRNVIQRFPNTEASSLSSVALASIDPSYAASAQALQAKSGEYKLLGPTPKDMKRAEFEIPYNIENGAYKVTAVIDGHNVEMYLNNNMNVCVFSTAQINQIDPSYLDNAGDANSKLVDPSNSNNLTETTTRTFRLKRVQLGRIQTSNVPAQVTDIISRTGLTWGGSERPILGGSATAGWRMEVFTDRRMLRFTQM